MENEIDRYENEERRIPPHVRHLGIIDTKCGRMSCTVGSRRRARAQQEYNSADEVTLFVTPAYFELDHRSNARAYGSRQSRHLGGFENPDINVMAFQALECPIFKTFIGGHHRALISLRRVFWTSWD